MSLQCHATTSKEQRDAKKIHKQTVDVSSLCHAPTNNIIHKPNLFGPECHTMYRQIQVTMHKAQWWHAFSQSAQSSMAHDEKQQDARQVFESNEMPTETK
jgi:hypothetical protein